MGHLSQLLSDHLAQRDISERQAAERCGMNFESFRKVARGLTSRPRDATLQKIADGLSIPMRRLIEARARDANEPYEPVIEDITTREALEIAIARIDDIPDEELPLVRAQVERLLRNMQAEAGSGGTEESA